MTATFRPRPLTDPRAAEGSCLWELRPGADGDTPTLLMLPHAGGSSHSVLPLAECAPAGLRVIAGQYPGRGPRTMEPPATSLHDLVLQFSAAVQQQLPGPLIVFGHSMGAMIGWQLCLELQRLGRPVQRFVASGCRPPHLHRRFAVNWRAMTRDDLIVHLKMLDGLPAEILEDPELADMVLATVRADFALTEQYPTEGVTSRLSAPILALGGQDDPVAAVGQLGRWAEMTESSLTTQALPGGHFFYLEDPARVVRLMLADPTVLPESAGSS